MNRSLLILLLLLPGQISLWGLSSHLLLRSQGDGAIVTGEEGDRETIRRASYLPSEKVISVRPRSGLETLSAGYQYRFGAETRFTLKKDLIQLHGGSLMVQSRKIGNSTTIQGPEASVSVSGSGCCMIEVETNGGFKALGVLGRFRLSVDGSEEERELMPGEVVFVLPGERGFGEKINVNLSKVIESSYLLSGFPNPASFQQSLESIASAQDQSIGKTFAAEVGDAKEADSFEVLPRVNLKPAQADLSIDDSIKKPNYEIPESDPLAELLGRSPRRMQSVSEKVIESEVSVPEIEASDKNVSTSESDSAPVIEPRPFPSRLLRPAKK